MSTTITLPDTAAFRGLVDWLKNLASLRRFGFVRTPSGDDFVVMRPEEFSELESILSDPVFLAALEAGVSDAVRGRVTRVERGLTLQNVVEGPLPCGESMAGAVETGVDDALAEKLSTLQRGMSLRDLL